MDAAEKVGGASPSGGFPAERLCVCVYLQKEALQLSAVLPAVLLGEEDAVRWDAVVRHPAVALQHPDDDVWEAVLGLEQKID